jgi:hypothetical protein
MVQITECPNCGKKGLVQRGNDLFQCLSCNFSRDLSEAERGNDISWVLIVGLGVALLLKVVQVFDSSQTPNYNSPNSRAAIAPEVIVSSAHLSNLDDISHLTTS